MLYWQHVATLLEQLDHKKTTLNTLKYMAEFLQWNQNAHCKQTSIITRPSLALIYESPCSVNYGLIEYSDFLYIRSKLFDTT